MTSTFHQFTSTCAPLNRNNVDTDQIIPARFLKGTVKVGLGKTLFNDLRYREDGSPNPDFVLNDPRYSGSQILVAPHNFGCGSSREHAPWALKDYGFRAIIAISFADIFRNNCLKNQILPVILPEEVVLGLLSRLEGAEPRLEVTIRLEEQEVLIPGYEPLGFDINPFGKKCLLEGVDDIGYTLKHIAAIQDYEARTQKMAL